jgi:phospholipid-binding lipoprotein MlaA
MFNNQKKLGLLTKAIFSGSFSLFICATSYAVVSMPAAAVHESAAVREPENAAAQETAAHTADAAITKNAANAQTAPAQATPPPNPDPYEKFNRSMFNFNQKLDKYVMKPVATFYKKIMPKPLFQGVHNVFNNVGTLTTIANDILQTNFYQMANDMWRLGLNTTLGIGGIFDVATRMGLSYYRNDFGLTLNYWGWDESDYLVLPFFGSNTIRDAVGIPVDYYEFSIYPYIQPPTTRYILYGIGVIDRRAQLLAYQSVMEEAAVDKYAFARNAYKQRRAYEINKNLHLSYKDRINNTGTMVETVSSEQPSGPPPNNDNP